MADKRISQLVERVDIANDDVLPIVASGATTTNKVTVSTLQDWMQENLDVGVTSVGITIGSTGTDVNVTGSPVTSSGNITINLPTASATNRGLLSSADWTTFNSKQPAGNYVTLDTAQNITAAKGFINSGGGTCISVSHTSGSGIAVDITKAGNNEALKVTKTSGSGNAMTVIGGNFEAPTIVKTGGTSSQFLKADGSVDSSTYLTTGSAGSTYVPYSGAAASVNLGVYSITANAINSAGSGSTAGQINLRSDAFFSLVNGYGSIASGTTNQFNLYQTTGAGVFRGAILSLNSITPSATRTFTLPDASGTLALTSNLSAYLPLTGGTLTGGLNGTSANFSGSVGIGTDTPEGSGLTVASGGILVSLDPGANRKVLELYATSTGAKISSSYVGASSYGNLELLTSGLARLTISDTGGVTLTGALNGTSSSFTGNLSINTSNILLGLGNGGSNESLIFSYNDNAASRSWRIIKDWTAFGDFQIQQSTTKTGTTYSDILRFTSTGAATFSSSASGYGITLNHTSENLRLKMGAIAGGVINIQGEVISSGGVYPIVLNRDGGNVGIGTASPLGSAAERTIHLSDGGGGYATVYVTNSANTVRSIFGMQSAGNLGIVGTQTNTPFAIFTNDTERMRITSGGDVLVGTTNDGFFNGSIQGIGLFGSNGFIAASRGSGSCAFFNRYTSTGDIVNFRYAGSNVGSISYNGTITQYNSTSDYRLKEDLQDFNALEIVSKLKTYDFNWKNADTRDYGMIAHELQEVLPSYVNGEKDELDEEGNMKPQGVDYSKIVPILIKAIQEQQIQIDSLKNQIK